MTVYTEKGDKGMKILRWIVNHFEEVFMVFSLIMITISMFAQVISRYVFSASLVWTEELSRYFFILLAFAGLSFGIRAKKHIRIDILETFIPKLKKPFELFADLCFLTFCIIMIRPAFRGVEFIMTSGQVSPAMEIPMHIVYVPLLVGILLSPLRIAEKYVNYLLQYKKDKKLGEGA